jgi:hypothetical protein
MTAPDDLRRRLEAMETEALVDVLWRHDLDEWRPEVFPIVESILDARGVDVAALLAEAERERATVPEDSPPFERVMDLPDPAVLAVAKSLLEEAGIPFFVKNEETQSLFGWGRLGTGYNVITGPPVVMVDPSRADEARELLQPLREPSVAGTEGEGAQDDDTETNDT